MVNKLIYQVVTELRVYFRDIIQMIFGFVLPIVIVVVFGMIFKGTFVNDIPYMDYIMPGVIAVTIMTTSLFTVGVSFAGYKETLILKKIFVTPVKVSSYLISLIMSRVVILMIQISILWIIADFAFNTNFDGNLFQFCLVFLMSTIPFIIIGFVVGVIVKSANAAIAISNSFYMGLTFVSAAFYPIDSFPEVMKNIIRLFPLINIVEPIRKVWVYGAWWPFSLQNISVIMIWSVVGIIIIIKKFNVSK